MTNLQVVGAGLGRTGTVSLKLALQELGVTPCHYMNEASNQDRDHHLKSILQGVENEESIKAVFEGFKATVDETGNIFYETFETCCKRHYIRKLQATLFNLTS